MKILAEKEKGFIVELSENELANVLGYYSAIGSGYYKDIKIAMKNTTDLPISEIYQKHYRIKNLQQQADYNTAIAKLSEMIEALTPVTNLLNDLPTIKEE